MNDRAAGPLWIIALMVAVGVWLYWRDHHLTDAQIAGQDAKNVAEASAVFGNMTTEQLAAANAVLGERRLARQAEANKKSWWRP